jgi:hypothetical protein
MPFSDLIQPIKLDQDTLRRLGGVLTEMVDDLEDAHRTFFDNIRVWWKWYEGEPKNAVKNWPFTNASNVVIPVIGTAADAATARDFSLIQSTRERLWNGRSHDENFTANNLSEVVNFMNWAGLHEFDTFWSILDWILESKVIGGSVLAVTWEEKTRHLILPGQVEPTIVNLKRAAKWQHIPAESILWEPGQPIREAEFVATQELPTWTKLCRDYIGDDGELTVDPEVLERVRRFPHEHGSPGAEVRAEKEERAGIDADLQISRRATYDLRRVWIDWPILTGLGIRGLEDRVTLQDEASGKRVRVPLWVDLAPDAQQVVRVLPNPYYGADGNPFFDIYYRKQVGYPRGVGKAKRLEQLQRAQSTVVNQANDARTLKTAMPFKTTDPKLAGRPITPGQGIVVETLESLQEFNIQGGDMFDLAMANFLQVNTERWSGVNDPLIGRESRSGGHPSPATNYTGMMQQASMMASVPTQMIREQMSAAALYTASLYQQFDTDAEGRIARVFGDADADRIKQWLFPKDRALVGTMKFDLIALSDQSNPQAQMSKAMTIMQATGMYWSQVIRLIQASEDQRVPPGAREASLKAVEVIGRVYQQFLEGADFDKSQEAILDLKEGNPNALSQLRSLAAGALAGGGEPGGGGGPAPQPPVGPPQGPPNGAAGGPLPNLPGLQG